MLEGGVGDDFLDGQGASLDIVRGGAGNDTLEGGSGNDTLDGGDGVDRVGEAADVNFTLTDAQLIGLGTDLLTSIEEAELYGRNGNNTLDASGFSGATTLVGGFGNDSLLGGSGDDLLNGGPGRDTLLGGAGDDMLLGGAGRDRLDGGAGDDNVFGQGSSFDSVTGGAGDDLLDGGAGPDWLIETGDVDFTLTNTRLIGLGTDRLVRVELARLTGGTGENAFNARAFTGSVQMMGLGGNDLLWGGSGHDLLNGGAGADTLRGRDGDDMLLGGSGRDWLDGGAGNDDVNGQGSSLDTLTGGPGDDILNGGAGTDILIESGDVDFTLTDTQLTGFGVDKLVVIELIRLSGGSGPNIINARQYSRNVTLLGGAGDGTLLGGTGSDIILGEDGNDLLNGSRGNDTLEGGDGNDMLLGGSGRDLLIGNDGNDFVDGQGGSLDTVIAGLGNDTISGGAGDDRFILKLGTLGPLTTINDRSGNSDLLTIDGTNRADTIDVNSSVHQITAGAETIAYTDGIEFLTINGGDGLDTFNVQPSLTANITIDGGAPSIVPAVVLPIGDTLNFFPAPGRQFSIDDNTIRTNGGSPPFRDVRFFGIENLVSPEPDTGERRFDFDRANSPTQDGFIGVLDTDTYSVARGYGWLTQPESRGLGGRSGPFAELRQDGHTSSGPRTFRVDFPNDAFVVNVTLGGGVARENMQVRANGIVVLDDVDTDESEYFHGTFTVEVTAGQLELEFNDLDDDGSQWVVNGLQIRPIDKVGTINLTAGPGQVEADGSTVDPMTGNSDLLPGSLVTVTTSLGTIITTDADRNYAGTQVSVQDGGEFHFDLLRPSIAGTPTLTAVAIDGAARGAVTDATFLNYVQPGVLRFDFGRISSPTQAGFLGVVPGDLYSAERGFGWLTPPTSRDRGSVVTGSFSDVLRDFHFSSTPAEFRVDLSRDLYTVNLILGDLVDRDNIQVTAEGNVVLADIDTAASQYLHRSFTVGVGDGALNLDFSDLGGDSNWVVNGLEVRSAASSETIAFTGGPGAVDADGSTVDTITGSSSLSPGTLVTITTTLGTIVTSDPNFAGTQVTMQLGGGFRFGLRRASGAGTPTLTATAIDGSAQTSINNVAIVDYLLVSTTARRFDFNHDHNGSSQIDSPTQSGFVGVQADDVYTSDRGFGWLTAASSFDSGTTMPYSVSSVDLYRDGHVGNGDARTFQIQVNPGTNHDVRVYVGGQDFGMDNVQVQAEDGSTVIALPTLAGSFTSVTLNGVSDTNGDGVLQITISDTDSAPFWSANGLEIAESAIGLPPVSPLIAAAGVAISDVATAALTEEQLTTVVTQAIAQWASAGATNQQISTLNSVNFQIADLNAQGYLGLAGSQLVLIDDDALGHGWYFDRSAVAVHPVIPPNRIDLLTTVIHELGHVLGYSDLDPLQHPHDVMSGTLSNGSRRLPVGPAAVDHFFGSLSDASQAGWLLPFE